MAGVRSPHVIGAEALDFALDMLRARAPRLTRLRLEERELLEHLRTRSRGQAIKFPPDPKLSETGLKQRVGRLAHLAGKQLEWATHEGFLYARVTADVEPPADLHGDALEALQALRHHRARPTSASTSGSGTRAP
jgi:hypothetical protein